MADGIDLISWLFGVNSAKRCSSNLSLVSSLNPTHIWNSKSRGVTFWNCSQHVPFPLNKQFDFHFQTGTSASKKYRSISVTFLDVIAFWTPCPPSTLGLIFRRQIGKVLRHIVIGSDIYPKRS